MIEIKNLTKIYSSKNKKFTALSGIDLSIEKGDIFGIIGLSGAGKSSLVRCINLLERPTQGSVHVNGIDMTGLNSETLRKTRQKIGMIFQGFNLMNSRTVYENIAFPLEITGMSKKDMNSRVMDLLNLMELGDKKDAYPATLSGGQKQRVGIARALANNPDVLLCDEVTSALDPQSTRQILNLLHELNRKIGVTLVVITHEMDVVKSICNRVAVMDQGEITFIGKTIDLFSQMNMTSIQQIPENIAKSAGNQKLIQLGFKGASAEEPILSSLIQTLGIEVNILEGTVENIQNCSIGRLIIGIENSPETVKKVSKYLTEKTVHVEVLN